MIAATRFKKSREEKIVALIEWSDEFSVDIPRIDKQHMILIRAINLLAWRCSTTPAAS